jgi:hypothetical protein
MDTENRNRALNGNGILGPVRPCQFLFAMTPGFA